MNCLSWNCRGLGNQPTVRQFDWLIKQKKPELVFIMESKLMETEWTPILQKSGFENLFVIDCDNDDGGRKGGLGLLWTSELQVTIKTSSRHHILASVDNQCNSIWDFCGVYGWSRTEEHHHTWELLRKISLEIGDKWLCGGDFNETLYHFEKKGGNLKADSRLCAFRDVVDSCGLQDLGFSGDPFTWSNNQRGEDHITERLDRFFGNEAWIECFPGYVVTHLTRKSSDHCPVLLSLDRDEEDVRPRSKPFRYEAMWLKDERCKPFCNNLWQQGGLLESATDFKQKIEDMGVELKQWEKREFGHIRKRCKELREELGDLQKPSNDPYTKDKQRLVEAELDDLHSKEEIMWKQRSRVDWLVDGDRNTGFFHRVAEGRKKRNHIREI
ncbi:uncharacterized protein LOC131007889 [Salvia miltiorrhiza]|uniref:uncharacterized protein LOC131007889 n=1 Tax=Salvia miltiorrhiza TaxID=226208 RepID=UPI0025ACBC25|nr:uncharacterized protein LOC131007889 [Salvia miltiorrhiza]